MFINQLSKLAYEQSLKNEDISQELALELASKALVLSCA